jgi:hypothetical protein
MRKLVLSLAAAGMALAFATPAMAQYYPAPQQPYGYGNAYGYNNNYGQVRALQARIDMVQRHIRMLDDRNIIRGRDADRLRDESRRIERRLRDAARYGLNPYEENDIGRRVANLEQRVRYATGNRWGRYGYPGYGGYNSGYGNYGNYDRDRDGRDDRYENDRGWDHDD